MMKTRSRTVALVAAGVLAGVLGGGVATATVSATAASQDTGGSSQTDGRGGHSGEKALTGSALTKATAVADKAVPGGKVERAETDSGDATYEVHMTKADGSEVTVKMDKSFALSGVESGKGK